LAYTNILGSVPYYSPLQITFFTGAAPRLVVASIDQALRYYERALGFMADQRLDTEVVVRRERASLVLCQGGERDLCARDGCCPWDVLVWIDDYDSLFEEYELRKANPRSWGSKGMKIVDPAGNVLLFKQESQMIGTGVP
jgi:catechol 2,3-dioxygenase-like lactoylglutathione lyase family enzyme